MPIGRSASTAASADAAQPAARAAAAGTAQPAGRIPVAGRAQTTTCVKELLAGRGDLSREQLIPLLQQIQAREGFLSQAAMTELATALDTPVASVYGVATFYNQFRFAPLGRHVIELCRGTACHVKQSLALQQHLQRRLRLRPDGNSADKRFTVIKVACLGACSIAPVIKVDGEFYGNLTVDRLDALLESLDQEDRGSAFAEPAEEESAA